MAMPDEKIVKQKIQGIAEHQSAFAKVFPKKTAITYQHNAEVIEAFERTLITPSRFDDFMNGDAAALSRVEQRGLKTFLKIDCKSGHDGKLLGGETYELLGKEHPFENQMDQGMYSVIKDEGDRCFLKSQHCVMRP